LKVRAGLLRLLRDLHEVSRDNQAFFNARLGLGAAPLVPYKKMISRSIAPDAMKGQDISVGKAKKAISDCKKAIGHPKGLAELSVYFCEGAVVGSLRQPRGVLAQSSLYRSGHRPLGLANLLMGCPLLSPSRRA
jgi:hypothetical protein